MSTDTTDTSDTFTAELRELTDRWAAAEVAGDVDALAALATADFRLVGPFGFILDKDQWLDRYASGDFVTTTLDYEQLDLRRHGDTAIVIGTQTQEAAYKGTPSDGAFRTT